MSGLEVAFGAGITGEQAALAELIGDRFASRLFDCDSTLWGEAAAAEAAIRLGWTNFEADAQVLIPQIEALRAEFASQGIDRIVLCGMGGSSLAPAVITRWAGVALTMLDSTHPAAVARTIGDAADLARTAVVVSSKSGSTIETRSHLASFEQAFGRAGIEPGSRIVIVTDPGSPLDEQSRAAGRRVFNADPNVGGRFSALTAFGLVPSGLAGADIRALVENAQAFRAALASDDASNPALRLAAALAAALPQRYVLATRADKSADWGLPAWIEQLVAESTGKDGAGVLPIALESNAVEFSAPPRNTLRVRLTADAVAVTDHDDVVVAGDLGGQLLCWEVATSALGRLMGIDPFNQPDVESAKVAARGALDAPQHGDETETPQPTPAQAIAELEAALPAGGYIVIQAFLDPGAPYRDALAGLRDRLASALDAPVALCFGPSYLHSTGQLHKGGPELGVFLQLLDEELPALPIAGSEHGFEKLITAQARGDREVLQERGRRVVALSASDPAATVEAMLEALGAEKLS